MTLRSPKKRRTTVRTFNRRTAKRSLLRAATALTAVAVTLGGGEVFAQQSTAQQNTTPAGWNLRWRKSTQVVPAQVHVPREDVFARPARTTMQATPAVSQRNAASQRSFVPAAEMTARTTPNAFEMARVRKANLPAATHQTAVASAPSAAQQYAAQQPVAVTNPIRQAGYVARQAAAVRHANVVRQAGNAQPSRNVRLAGDDQPIGNYRAADQSQVVRPNDFFNNPFERSAQVAAPVTTDTQPGGAVRFTQGPVEDLPEMSLPEAVAPPASPSNSLRGPNDPVVQSGPSIMMPQAPDEESTQQAPAVQEEMLPPQAEREEGLRNFLDNPEALTPPAQATEEPAAEPKTDSPSDRTLRQELYDNPFDQLDKPNTDPGGPSLPMRTPRADLVPDTTILSANEVTCEEFREKIASQTIDKLTLDISPPFRPDLFDPKDFERQREKFDRAQKTRDWRNIEGEPIASGRLVDLAYENVVIESEDGKREEIPFYGISEGDLGYIAENWGLPKECLLEQTDYTPRDWHQLTMTWKASNLCSKQRYFEQVNLERYGHTAGPWLQPAVSSAHFFVNIAVLPYKMGIHPPNECHYALGYYRPGDCAPWIVPPVPISPRGALTQTAAMTGLFLLVP